MTRRTFIILIGLLGATVLVVGAVLWFWPRGPLAGDWRHDFGDVLVPRGGITLQHTFSLRNRTDHDVTIRKISPSCGCTEVQASRQTVPPGDAVELDISFHLAGSSGKKHANVMLDLGEAGAMTVTVAANRIRADQTGQPSTPSDQPEANSTAP